MKTAVQQGSFPSWRRAGCVCLMLAAVVWGCSSPRAKTTSRAPAPAKPGHVAAAASQVGPVPAKIVSVNPELKFVVIDFSTGTMPPIGTRLSVYRGEKEVGVVRVTEPARAQLATADIVEGEARVGDEAR